MKKWKNVRDVSLIMLAAFLGIAVLMAMTGLQAFGFVLVLFLYTIRVPLFVIIIFGAVSQVMLMLKKDYFVVMMSVLLAIMLIPVPKKDSGFTAYKALIYEAAKIDRIGGYDPFYREKGWRIKVFGYEVYEKTTQEKLVSGKDSVQEDLGEKPQMQEIDIRNLDDFYSLDLTKDRDIRKLKKEYTAFDAQKDMCFMLGAKVYNEDSYTIFFDAYQNKNDAFIRVAETTKEGNLILKDILYYAKADTFYLVVDNTRDEYAGKENRMIELREYEKMTEYSYQGHLYWVLYNGEINDENFAADNIYVAAYIN